MAITTAANSTQLPPFNVWIDACTKRECPEKIHLSHDGQYLHANKTYIQIKTGSFGFVAQFPPSSIAA